eukprot:gene11006-biopygen6557
MCGAAVLGGVLCAGSAAGQPPVLNYGDGAVQFRV